MRQSSSELRNGSEVLGNRVFHDESMCSRNPKHMIHVIDIKGE